MLKVVFTLDYEIHGNGDGCSYELMVEPTDRMMRRFEAYGAKLTIMADVAEILKFREYKEQFGRDDYHYGAITEQLRDAIRRGHDVQLHLHSSYFNAQFKGGRWEQDWSEYNLAGLPYERLNGMVRTGKRYLEDLLKSIDPQYACVAFRAANWSMTPSSSVVRALCSNGIGIDTSVFKYGRREGMVNFDYSNAHSDLVPWRVADDDICRRDSTGRLIEIPIYCERRWLGVFLTPNRVHRVIMSKAHRLAHAPAKGTVVEPVQPRKPRLLGAIGLLMQRHAWKADFNQCTGRQLIRALGRAEKKAPGGNHPLPFVLIGHSKQFSLANERSLRPFLEYVAANQARFGFATFTDCVAGAREFAAAN